MTDAELLSFLKMAHDTWESLDQSTKDLVEQIIPASSSNDFIKGFITAVSMIESIKRANPELNKDELVGAILLMSKKCLSIQYINFIKSLETKNEHIN